MSDFLLALFILNLSVAFGAGLYETRLIVPYWFRWSAEGGYQVNTAAMRAIDPGRKFWGFVTTIPLTLLTFANLVVAWQSTQPRHDWWLAAALITLLERVGTFAFFIPIAIKLQRADELLPEKASQLATWWVRLNYVRSGLNLLAWGAALAAFSLC